MVASRRLSPSRRSLVQEEFTELIAGLNLHDARSSIEAAKRRTLGGGVFTGFGPALDPGLNGFARVLHQQRAGWPARQREVMMR
jgi:hypothetical protein